MMKKNLIFTVAVLFLLMYQTVTAQKVVGLDNWFNRETNKKTGQLYHYLWTDTAWSGYSRWGKIFTEQGAKITQLEEPSVKLLKKIDVYIIVDPDTTTESENPHYISGADAKTIANWVKKGGVLVLLANDAPNCEFTHLNQLASKFGMTFDHVTLHPVIGKQWEMGAFTSLPDHPLFKGISKIYMKEISSITLSGNAKPILSENGKVFMAESAYGKGRVIAIGDPWIYNEYIDHDRLPADFQNHQAAENLSKYVLSLSKK